VVSPAWDARRCPQGYKCGCKTLIDYWVDVNSVLAKYLVQLGAILYGGYFFISFQGVTRVINTQGIEN
jgi:hypothetical protein